MDNIGLDLHKRETQLCLLTDAGELIEQRIATTRARFTAVLGPRPRSRILLEASTESEWVARHLESLGHEVIIADPGYAPMYASRSRRVKTDRRDARTLAEACRLGAYRAGHRASDAQRHVRAALAVREALVRTRTRYVALIKALVRRDGLRLAQGMPERTAAKLATLELPSALTAELAPLLALLEPLNAQIEAADRDLATLAAGDPVVARLRTAPGIGPVTAVALSRRSMPWSALPARTRSRRTSAWSPVSRARASGSTGGGYIGLEEVHDGLWNLVYYETLLGRFDEHTHTITGAPSLKTKC